ncbi:MAG: hypothetical protein ACXVQV_03105 [Actinomycetota bacterium]
MGDDLIDERVPEEREPDDERVRSRARSLAQENPADVEDPEAQARAMLSYSDALQSDPATRDLEDGRVERRTSEDATPPPDVD